MPYVSPAWPTQDQVIPWKLFQLGYQQMRHVIALQRLSQTRAVAQGTLIASPAKSKSAAISREKKVLAVDQREAFPDLQADEEE